MVVSPQNPDKPRIISEVKKKKSCLEKIKLGFTTSLHDFGKPKISGQLIWNVSPSECHLRTAEVRHGSLFVFKNGSSSVDFRMPLRQLSLQPCSSPRTFCLTQGQDSPLVTFQALTDEEYEKWVKVLAVELIRQTPLQDVRFLDIISITRKRESEASNMRRGRSEECLMLVDEALWDRPLKSESDFSRNRIYRSLTMDAEPENERKTFRNKYNFKEDAKKRSKRSERIAQNDVLRQEPQKTWRALRPSLSINVADVMHWSRAKSVENVNNMKEKIVSDESGISSGDENNNTIESKSPTEEIEGYCFVSVREKKKFFESLSSDLEGSVSPSESGILTRSNSIGDLKLCAEESTKLKRRKRTKSLHDLSRTPVPVREICRLFEPQNDRGDEEEEESDVKLPSLTSERNAVVMLNQRRLQRGERKLAKLRVLIAEVEETIKVIAEDLRSIASNTLKRREGAEIYAALQRRLAEENSRLERLQEETTKVIKENQRTITKLKKCEEEK